MGQVALGDHVQTGVHASEVAVMVEVSGGV